MADAWDQPSSTLSETSREFYISVELYVSSRTAAALRKPVPRKKNEKRDIQRPLSLLTDDAQRKVKGRKLRDHTEKTSWLNLARALGTGDQWRQATCRITEDGESCLLNVYIDETMLYQCVYIHLLNHTDIRPADRSLFYRKDCLGLHCASAQRWTATATNEPLYFYFPSTEAMNTWMCLLRSYANPEVYGKGLSPPDGGLYRIWRQVELTCIQGRNIGTPRSLGEGSSLSPGTPDEEGRGDDAVDLDLFCEVHFNHILSGRTVVKKSLGAPDWHESFTFTDLPPFEKLAIVLWREKKLMKPSMVGTVYVTLTNFRRGEHVEGWFPVLYGGSTASSVQVGQIRLKLKVDEEIVLPHSAYARMVNVVIPTLDERNYLDWMRDFELELKMKHVSSELVSVAIAKNILIQNVFELADHEVDGTPTSHNTLFRGNTVFTKTVELLMAWYGKNFLEASIGDTIRRICADNIAIEVDPVRNGKGSKDIERNVDLLVHWCQQIWNQIYSVRSECPNEMRRLFERIRQLVERRYRFSDNNSSRELPWQSVSAFCFLRFIVPAILHPHLFGLCPGLPDLPVQRSLTLIAKVIQSLANLNSTVQKEEFMRGVRSFLEESVPAMIDYILVVSTPNPHSQPSPTTEESKDRLKAVKVLQERTKNAPSLYRECVPLLPYLLDVPRHLAVISSAVLRHSRNSPPIRNPPLEDLFNCCSDIEQQALFRVSRLAERSSIDQSSHSAESSQHDPVGQHVLPKEPPVIPKSRLRRPSQISRPMTAPTISDDASRSQESSTSPPLPPSLDLSHTRGLSSLQIDVSGGSISPTERSLDAGSWPNRKRLPPSHPRSISTDSIPVFRRQRSPTSSSSPLSPTISVHQTGDGDEVGKWKTKGFLRGILVRR
ncbi:hypothetical protein EW146_g3826 [Bondarzewia mesenterica]|uniref:Uncharacterized protein n=1 Tax=Bondarzewia mesenterica TaxID=1095465 RepID=A0A4S4LWD8_9AGAM|nr:hypothetical protein EW146_g3826 [Bondarzewia mesenterica]